MSCVLRLLEWLCHGSEKEAVHFLYVFMTKAVSYQYTGLIMGFSMTQNHGLNQSRSGLRFSENRGGKLII